MTEPKLLPATQEEFASQAAKQQGHVEPLAPQSIELLTAKQAASCLHVHPVTLLRWAREGTVPHRRLGKRKVLFPSKELESWLVAGYSVPAVHAAPTSKGDGA